MIDSHAHVNFDLFDSDRDQVVKRAIEAGLQGWMEIGTNLEDSRQAAVLAEKHQGVFAAAGVHPGDLKDMETNHWPKLKELFSHDKVKAVGEVGLDFYRGGNPAEQIPALKEFITLAQETGLPIVFHVRSGDIDAHEELINLLKTYSGRNMPRGVVHTFSGTMLQAQRYMDFGLYLSVSGVVTFKNAGDMAVVAREAPLERLLIETDCPYLAPAPYRGKRNEPAYVALVAQKIAELRNTGIEEVKQVTTQNTQKLFGI